MKYNSLFLSKIRKDVKNLSSAAVLIHTGKCIRRFAGILRILPLLHRPDVADIGVNTILKNMQYATRTIDCNHV